MLRLLLLVAVIALPCFVLANGQKLRGMWVDVFHEGIKTPMQVTQLIERARRARVNTLFIQVRSRAQVYHISAYEHRAPDTMPMFDGLAEVIKQAKAQNPPIQVHAWLNAHPLWTDAREPIWPDHVIYRKPDWLTRSIDGSTSTPVGRAIDFGHPEAAEYVLKLYLEVVRKYDVDGVHMDFIRYAGNEWGYNPVSIQRFYDSLTPEQVRAVQARSAAAKAPVARTASGQSIFPGAESSGASRGAAGLPATDDPLFSDWRREQVTELVRKVSFHSKAIKPEIIVSAAAIPWGDAPSDFTRSAAYSRCFQDWKGWAEEGILDLIIPMLYFREHNAQHAQWYRNWVNYCNRINGKTPIAAGIGNWLNEHTNTLTQARYADERLAGVCFFSYASTNPFPGQEAEKFNERFYNRLGELPRALPLGPNPNGAFTQPRTFGYRLGDDLSTSFYVGEPTRRQTALGHQDSARMGLLALQVDEVGSRIYRKLSAVLGLPLGQEFTLAGQVVRSQEDSGVQIADSWKSDPAMAVLPGEDAVFIPGDILALRGVFDGEKIIASAWRWLGVRPRA